jgi:hypothetical protein
VPPTEPSLAFSPFISILTKPKDSEPFSLLVAFREELMHVYKLLRTFNINKNKYNLYTNYINVITFTFYKKFTFVFKLKPFKFLQYGVIGVAKYKCC